MVFIVAYRPFKSKKKFILELVNEIVTLIAIYLLLLYAGDYIQDVDTKEGLGNFMIVLTLLNFLASVIDACYAVCQTIRQRYL